MKRHVSFSTTSLNNADVLFNDFVEADDCPAIVETFDNLLSSLDLRDRPRWGIYEDLKQKLTSWKFKELLQQLDTKASSSDYGKGKLGKQNRVLVIGAGPVGLRAAIECRFLGCDVVVVEKRRSFSRNNVLHLWPFLISDFRDLGAKKFYGKFCSGSLDHISIRTLQCILLKVCLLLGVTFYTQVQFHTLLEPDGSGVGWRGQFQPSDHQVNKFEFTVVVCADGKKNSLPGFPLVETRGALAIGITCNFVNYRSTKETMVQEISGISYQFNPGVFDELNRLKGIQLENIVYYRDDTHYFVMTASKPSLLRRGVLKQDFPDSEQLLASSNVDKEKLILYAIDAADHFTNSQLPHHDLQTTGAEGHPDIACFDFTSFKKASHAACLRSIHGKQLLLALAGDSLIEPFWPTGSGCGRGVLSALDAAWMVRAFCKGKDPSVFLLERDFYFRILASVTSDQLKKKFSKYTIRPSSRYSQVYNKRSGNKSLLTELIKTDETPLGTIPPSQKTEKQIPRKLSTSTPGPDGNKEPREPGPKGVKESPTKEPLSKRPRTSILHLPKPHKKDPKSTPSPSRTQTQQIESPFSGASSQVSVLKAKFKDTLPTTEPLFVRPPRLTVGTQSSFSAAGSLTEHTTEITRAGSVPSNDDPDNLEQSFRFTENTQFRKSTRELVAEMESRLSSAGDSEKTRLSISSRKLLGPPKERQILDNIIKKLEEEPVSASTKGPDILKATLTLALPQVLAVPFMWRPRIGGLGASLDNDLLDRFRHLIELSFTSAGVQNPSVVVDRNTGKTPNEKQSLLLTQTAQNKRDSGRTIGYYCRRIFCGCFGYDYL